MTSSPPENRNLEIRPIQYRDLEAIEQLLAGAFTAVNPSSPLCIDRHLGQIRQFFGWFKCLSWFPNPYQNLLRAYVARRDRSIEGFIQVSPFNRTASTWRVDRVGTNPASGSLDVGTSLLRYCLEHIWEARTWLVEVGVGDRQATGLYRQNGFQPLAQMTYWQLDFERLQELGESEPNLPNLMPVGNADARLLYQLDTAAMPPLVRQVFDRHMSDFKVSLFGSLVRGCKQWLERTEVVSGYIFEPQRKAAIGYFQMRLSRDGSTPHQAELTVHPAYTWLYPELLTQMARIVREFPPQSLQLASTDYQAEREEYLERIGAEPVERTLLMCRSVWHKLRETKPTSIEVQLSGVLNGLKPVGKPLPGRMMCWESFQHLVEEDRQPTEESGNSRPSQPKSNDRKSE